MKKKKLLPLSQPALTLIYSNKNNPQNPALRRVFHLVAMVVAPDESRP